MTSPPVLEVRGLKKHFPVPRSRGGGTVHAVDGVDVTIRAGEVLGLVGESGSGKSTVGKCVVRLLEPTGGTIALHGRDISHLSQRELRPMRRQVHMVFQDPYSSLDPRQSIGDIVAEPLRMHGGLGSRELGKKVESLLDKVGLATGMRYRYPHELSGGQRQRVGLARSLSLDPSLLIADEPVSALDVSVQASVLNLLMDLQEDLGFSCLFIAHDLATVELVCNRVAVLYLGRIVEEGTREEIFTSPKHPYTQSLLSAIAVPDPPLQRRRERIILTGDIPSPIDPPSGCTFHTRCPVADLPRCADEVPILRPIEASARQVSCHLVGADGTAPDAAKAAARI
ncbi:MAG: peptide/nickel transport system ATP-binding protein [Pseudonocardiales bacterium]|jgi:oligopeptide/dipeptide ABC transporter ATP-binding protein|nr:peptide transporter ATP-binding protein [Pseudonocardia sp.]MDT7648842.1 peptide/nickel transport system ATP-binding protein [Pseudonocardiales bacterium]